MRVSLALLSTALLGLLLAACQRTAPAHPTRVNDDGPAGFVLVPAGEFQMGVREDSPLVGRVPSAEPFTASITRPFWMGITEVTSSEWEEHMPPSPRTSCPDCPVVGISWWDAIEYANARSRAEGLEQCYRAWGCEHSPPYRTCEGVAFRGVGCAGYRLPTEAEWEYAARAGTQSSWTCGDDEACAEALPNIFDCVDTVPVGDAPANAFGLRDMIGNAREWTYASTRRYPRGYVDDPAEPGIFGGQVAIRGSSCDGGTRTARVAFRGALEPDEFSSTLGLRLVRAADPDPAGLPDPCAPLPALRERNTQTPPPYLVRLDGFGIRADALLGPREGVAGPVRALLLAEQACESGVQVSAEEIACYALNWEAEGCDTFNAASDARYANPDGYWVRTAGWDRETVFWSVPDALGMQSRAYAEYIARELLALRYLEQLAESESADAPSPAVPGGPVSLPRFGERRTLAGGRVSAEQLRYRTDEDDPLITAAEDAGRLEWVRAVGDAE